MTSVVRHKKHANLEKPKLGHYSRNEVAILGAPCPIIQQLANQIAQSLEEMEVTFMDADHSVDQSMARFPGHLLTDKISHHRLDYAGTINDYDQKLELMDKPLVLINGNHFKAAQQIVILNSKKKESLSRKLDRLTNVRLILTDDEETPFDFLQDHIPNLHDIPIGRLDDINLISRLVRESVQIPPVFGLVLAGGDSRRMGKDKTKISYHDKPQAQFAFEIMDQLVERTFISCKHGQEEKFSFTENYVLDTFTGLGPFGAVLSAFRKHPNHAWLVVATDQPLLGKEELERLIIKRDPAKFATCYYNPETQFPEPLITLWEPGSYQRMLQFLSLGYSCPRKVLINSPIQMIEVSETSFMKNANTPEEHDQLQAMLASRS